MKLLEGLRKGWSPKEKWQITKIFGEVFRVSRMHDLTASGLELAIFPATVSSSRSNSASLAMRNLDGCPSAIASVQFAICSSKARTEDHLDAGRQSLHCVGELGFTRGRRCGCYDGAGGPDRTDRDIRFTIKVAA